MSYARVVECFNRKANLRRQVAVAGDRGDFERNGSEAEKRVPISVLIQEFGQLLGVWKPSERRMETIHTRVWRLWR
jgi:hypothetical protein